MEMTANTATTSRAKVVLSPVAASLTDSCKPRKLTELSPSGSLVAGRKKKHQNRFIYINIYQRTLLDRKPGG